MSDNICGLNRHSVCWTGVPIPTVEIAALLTVAAQYNTVIPSSVTLEGDLILLVCKSAVSWGLIIWHTENYALAYIRITLIPMQATPISITYTLKHSMVLTQKVEIPRINYAWPTLSSE